MIRASRLKLPPAEPPIRTIGPWLFVVFVLVATIVSWWFHITAAAVVFTVLSSIIAVGFVATSFERRRQREAAAKLPHDASCTVARSFDFRHTDTFAMRAVFEELQPFVKIPILASHRLVEDLQLDDEDLNLDFLPIIAQRLRRSLSGTQKNPYYGRVQTVEDLVHFMEAQPIEETQKT